MTKAKLGIKVTLVAITSTLVLGIISLLRVRLILQNYGAELNGLVQVATQISAYLVLIESGMTAAYQYRLYSKIEGQSFLDVSRLYRGLRLNMKKIGLKMLFVGSVIPFAYASFINRTTTTYFEAVLVLLVMSIRMILPYLLTVPQCGLIAAFEGQYIVDLVQLSLGVAVIILEALAIHYFRPPLYIVLMIYTFCILLSVPIYDVIVRKLTDNRLISDVQADMTPVDMTNDILVHQISSMVFFNTDNFLMSIFDSLRSVSVYSAYNSLISYPNELINKVIRGLRASLALKIHARDSNAIDVYNEILSVESFCASIVVPMFILMSSKFVALWIGEQYTLDLTGVILFALIILNRMITPIAIAARDARGLYKESKGFTILQAVCNIMISVVLIKPLGITGVLVGTVISSYFIATPCNFRLVDRVVFQRKGKAFFTYIKAIIASGITVCIGTIMRGKMLFSMTWNGFVSETLVLICVAVAVSGILYLSSDKHFLRFLTRIPVYRIRQ